MKRASMTSGSAMSMVALLVAGAFVAGRMSAGGWADRELGARAGVGLAAGAGAGVAAAVEPAAAFMPAPARAAVPRPIALPAAPPAGPDPTLQQARIDRAAFLLDRVFEQLKSKSALPDLPSAEAQATAVEPYLTGLLEGAVQSDPGMRAAFGAQLRARLCGDRAPTDAEAISLAHVVTALPDAATEESLDCFFDQAKEGVPLWSMMDAWRASGMPKTAALARIEASAHDQRTVRRLASLEEQARRRAPAQ